MPGLAGRASPCAKQRSADFELAVQNSFRRHSRFRVIPGLVPGIQRRQAHESVKDWSDHLTRKRRVASSRDGVFNPVTNVAAGVFNPCITLRAWRMEGLKTLPETFPKRVKSLGKRLAAPPRNGGKAHRLLAIPSPPKTSSNKATRNVGCATTPSKETEPFLPKS